jgi:hypothetical protein
MCQRLFCCASSDYSLGAGLEPAILVSLKRLQHLSFFIEKFYYAIIVPHEITIEFH